MTLDPKDIRIETFSNKQGGFTLGVSSVVKATHIPSGISVTSDEDRSQHRNRATAVEKLEKLVQDWKPIPEPKMGLTIPFEVADGIVLASMKEHLGYLKQEIDDHRMKGTYMHPEDYRNILEKYIPALELLIKYYGG